MKFCRRKIIATLLIVTALLPLLLPIAFKLKERIVEWKMEREMEDSANLQTIQIPINDVVWVEDHEILVDGRMFDIKTKRLQNGFYLFTGLFDDEETNLARHANDQSEMNRNSNGQLVNLVDSLLHLYFNKSEENTTNILATVSYPFLIASKLPNTFYPVYTPPPQS